uniref:Sam-pr protein n=2 Tax=Streptomyces TaxID=1883 RepID=Q9Z9S6_STRAO|nr:sam-pr [Streptomyces albogriseolus]
MRTASVAQGEGARLAAAVSLVLASAKVRDHVTDGDGLLARRPVALAARRVAASWDRAGARTGSDVGFDTAVLVDAVDRQTGVESLAGPGTPVLAVTEPTETATAAAFAHTAVLAGRPHNAGPLAEAGRLFGRLAHLLDAVEDREADAASGAWNPLSATGTSLDEARRLADDAVHGIRLALREVEFTDGSLAHRLLVHELPDSVRRVFGTPSCAHGSHPYAPPGAPGAPGGPTPPGPPRRDRRGLLAGCAVWLGLACTCQLCCGTYEDPWTRERKEGCLNNCDCDCCECCDCCSCCGEDGCCGGCDCGCDC